MDSALELIKNLNIMEDEYVVLACSFGPDSMCLLDLLRKSNLNVVVAHVNHKYRKESDQEYLDLENYCKNNQLIFEGMEITDKVVGNQEEFYRNYRYKFFKNIVNKYKAKYLFTAHHGDDLVETILMRLSRGSSFKGYSGFSAVTKNKDYTIVRPLIYVTKEDIMKYVLDNSIPYAIDQTNFNDLYTRNKYRHNILPILKEINPKIHKKFIKFSNTIIEYNDYIEKEVDKLYSVLYLNNRLDLNEFLGLPLLLQKNLLKKILLNIYENNINRVSDKHISMILELTLNDKKNSFVCLPNGLLVSKYYNILEFSHEKDIVDYDVVFKDEYHKDNWSILRLDNTDIVKSNYLLRLSSADVKLPLHIRNRKAKDKIVLKNGTKKVGEILSESKIPMYERNILPIMTDDEGKILWIPGIKKSKFDKQVNEDYDIIVKYIKKEKSYEE